MTGATDNAASRSLRSEGERRRPRAKLPHERDAAEAALSLNRRDPARLWLEATPAVRWWMDQIELERFYAAHWSKYPTRRELDAAAALRFGFSERTVRRRVTGWPRSSVLAIEACQPD